MGGSALPAPLLALPVGLAPAPLLKRTYLGVQAQRACETSSILGGGVKQSKRSPPLEPIACPTQATKCSYKIIAGTY